MADTILTADPAHLALADEFATLRDLFRYAVTRLNGSDLVFGHGTTNALDEAAFIVLEALSLPVDRLDVFLDARATRAERLKVIGLVEARIATRKPAAYLLNRCYIQGMPFYVDERVIVPRSFIGELLLGDLFSDESQLVEDADGVGSVLDLCTGGGSLAVIAARVFPNARIDAVDLSADALDVARRNVEDWGLEDRVELLQGDLFAPLEGRRYDLIITNPPYVDADAVANFPPEYAAEPQMAHLGGEDGLDLVHRILAGARDHLTDEGALICEIGRGRQLLEAAYPTLNFVWLDTEESAGEVFWLAARDLPRRTPSPRELGPKPTRH